MVVYRLQGRVTIYESKHLDCLIIIFRADNLKNTRLIAEKKLKFRLSSEGNECVSLPTDL